jgi:hypothetical protein
MVTPFKRLLFLVLFSGLMAVAPLVEARRGGGGAGGGPPVIFIPPSGGGGLGRATGGGFGNGIGRGGAVPGSYIRPGESGGSHTRGGADGYVRHRSVGDAYTRRGSAESYSSDSPRYRFKQRERTALAYEGYSTKHRSYERKKHYDRYKRHEWKHRRHGNHHHRHHKRHKQFIYFYDGWWYDTPWWTYTYYDERLSCSEARWIVQQHYRRVRTLECSGRIYTFTAVNNRGRIIELSVNSLTGDYWRS